jgi:hypothetical protein
MIRSVQDTAYPSGAVTAGALNPFQTGATLEGIDATVLDNRTGGSAALPVGKLWIEQFVAANTGDANYAPSAAAAQAVPWGSFGVCTGIPVPSAPAYGTALAPGTTSGGGNEIRIRQKGICLAYATSTANASAAIAPGTPLGADGAGNLTTLPATVLSGTCLAISKGTLAGGTATPTLILVTVGGY